MRSILRRALLFAAAVVGACGTGGSESGLGRELPNAMAGPFRELRKDELPAKSLAPWVIRRRGVRDPAALDSDGDPRTLGVVLYAAIGLEDHADGAPSRIIRYEADDGRALESAAPSGAVRGTLWRGGIALVHGVGG
jgi:hypothetical protein